MKVTDLQARVLAAFLEEYGGRTSFLRCEEDVVVMRGKDRIGEGEDILTLSRGGWIDVESRWGSAYYYDRWIIGPAGEYEYRGSLDEYRRPPTWLLKVLDEVGDE